MVETIAYLCIVYGIIKVSSGSTHIKSSNCVVININQNGIYKEEEMSKFEGENIILCVSRELVTSGL